MISSFWPHSLADRRQAYDLELRRRRVPGVLLSDGTESEPRIPTDAGLLAGTVTPEPTAST